MKYKGITIPDEWCHCKYCMWQYIREVMLQPVKDEEGIK